MSLKRFEDWPVRLDAYLRYMAEEPFSWGSNDCAMFACNVVNELTGTDVAKHFRGKYQTKKAALAALMKFCGAGLEDTALKIASRHTVKEIVVRKAQRGDMVLLEGTQGPTLAIVTMDGANVTAPGPTGLVRWPLGLGQRAWRIG